MSELVAVTLFYSVRTSSLCYRMDKKFVLENTMIIN